MFQFDSEQPALREQIAHLEDEIEALAARIENCRKGMMAARIALGAAALVFILMIVGMLRPERGALLAGIVASLGGIVLYGSSRSTAEQMRAKLAVAEARRRELIGMISLEVVG
jgi:hypothetical protein